MHGAAKCLLILAAAFLGVSATVFAANVKADDSLNRSVAVFISSNFKLALQNALSDLKATGVDVDTAAVQSIVLEELSKPYNADAHRAASDAIEAAIENVARAASDSMLHAAAASPGAKILPSGVVIETILPGNGPFVMADDTVVLRYTGRLPDGSVFDSIAPDATPMTSPASQLVPGMTEGLRHMQAGGEYRLTLPPASAYGVDGVPGVIPPQCALQFDISLLEILQ